jgi:hypothetical protein
LCKVELRGFEPLTFSLRRPDTEAYELLRGLLLGAWRGVGLVLVRLRGHAGGTHRPFCPASMMGRSGAGQRLARVRIVRAK